MKSLLCIFILRSKIFVLSSQHSPQGMVFTGFIYQNPSKKSDTNELKTLISKNPLLSNENIETESYEVCIETIEPINYKKIQEEAISAINEETQKISKRLEHIKESIAGSVSTPENSGTVSSTSYENNFHLSDEIYEISKKKKALTEKIVGELMSILDFFPRYVDYIIANQSESTLGFGHDDLSNKQACCRELEVDCDVVMKMNTMLENRLKNFNGKTDNNVVEGGNLIDPPIEFADGESLISNQAQMSDSAAKFLS